MTRRRETPLKYRNPSGAIVWKARWTDSTGKRRYGYPPDIPGTFDLKREAQAAIDACYDRDAVAPGRHDTVGVYAASWLKRHPRATRTNRGYQQKVDVMLAVKLEGRAFRDWPMVDVKRRHAKTLVDVMLREQGRAANGAQAVLRVLSAMFMDALDDDVATANPFHKVTVRASDPRVQKAPRRIQVWSWADMHGFAAAAGEFKAQLLILSDCGLRLGELLPLEHGDIWDGHLVVSKTAYEGRVQAGTKVDHGTADAGRRVPLTPSLEALLRARPRWATSPLLFPNPRGGVWLERVWYREVWQRGRDQVPAMAAAIPHEFRHSFVSHMLVAGVDPAYVAEMTGHTVLTAMKHYRHVTARDSASVREAVGA